MLAPATITDYQLIPVNDVSATLKQGYQLYGGVVVAAKGLLQAVVRLTLPTAPMTEREQECLEQLLKGLSTKQIAEQLGISGRTAEKHLLTLKRKWQCDTIKQLIAKVNAHT